MAKDDTHINADLPPLVVGRRHHLELGPEVFDCVDRTGNVPDAQQGRDGGGDVPDPGPDQLGGATAGLIPEISPFD